MPETSLPDAFLARPIAHRGLHDAAAGRIENSLSAIRAAVAAGFGVELDVQPSADGVPMVFHDETLERLTAEAGPISALGAADLARIALKGSADTILPLSQVLEAVAGRAALLIEIKDQDGALGPGVGPLERAVASALAGYEGPVAVMSFNPHSVAAFGAASPALPRGLVTEEFRAEDWPGVPAARRAELNGMADFAASGACFVSHDRQALDMPEVAALKAQGVPVLCWTIRSAEQEEQARRIADNITFEGYIPAPRD